MKTFEQMLSESGRELQKYGEGLPNPPPASIPNAQRNGVILIGTSLVERVWAAEARLAEINRRYGKGPGRQSLAEMTPRMRPPAPILEAGGNRLSAGGPRSEDDPPLIRRAFEAARAEKDPRKRAILFSRASEMISCAAPTVSFEAAAKETDPMKRAVLFRQARESLK